MKLIPFTMLVIAAAMAGCGKEETAAPAAPNTPPKQILPALQPSAETATPAQPGTAATPAPPAAIDLATMQRPVNDKGDLMSDLEMLNQILANFNEARATGATAGTQARTYKTEAEQMAAETARQQAVGPARDLLELVKAGVIKALPTPPAGKKFVIDPQSHKVVLANAP